MLKRFCGWLANVRARFMVSRVLGANFTTALAVALL